MFTASLFEDNHPSGRSEIGRLQRVEVDTTRNTLTDSIPTIPIRSTRRRHI